MLEKVNKYIRQEEQAAEKLKMEPASRSKVFRGDATRQDRGWYPFSPYEKQKGRGSDHGRKPETYLAHGRRGAGRGSHFRRFPHDRNLFCEFHKKSGHTIANCEAYKKEKLKERVPVGGNKGEQVKEEEKAYDAELMMIHVREGGEKRRRTSMRDVDFSERDPIPQNYQGDEPLLVSATIGRILVRRIYVDTGSSSNIMYDQCFSQLPQEIRSFIRPPTNFVVGFAGQAVWPVGKIDIPITFYDHRSKRKKTVLAEFIIIRAASPYNIIWGRTGLWQLQAVASTVHGTMKIPDKEGVITVVCEKSVQCYATNQRPLKDEVEETVMIHVDGDVFAKEQGCFRMETNRHDGNIARNGRAPVEY